MANQSVPAPVQAGRVVVCDDEPVITDILRRRLVRDGHEVATAASADQARAVIQAGGVQALLADIQMPRENGLDLLAWARRHDGNLAVIMITAVGTISTAVDALKAGASDYILKPFNLDQVSFAVHRALERRRVVMQNHAYRESLEAMVEEKTAAHAAALEEIRFTYGATLKALGAALSYRDGSSPHHSERVAAIAVAIGARMQLAEADLDAVERAALLHDIGKMAIPDEVLRKTDGFTPEEEALLRDHPRKGHELLSRIAFLRPAAVIVHAQAERWDGGGYPSGLAGEAIPPGARVLAVANAYDILTAGRPFQPPVSDAEARATLQAAAGTRYDPRVVAAFLELGSRLFPLAPTVGKDKT